MPTHLSKPNKVKSRKSAKAAAVKWFNRFIVLRNSKRCVQCGSTERPTCGHVIPKGNGEALLFSEYDCFCQCWAHNYKHSHFPEEYTSWFLHRYGIEAYDELRAQKKQVVKYTTEQFRAIAEVYKVKCEALSE